MPAGLKRYYGSGDLHFITCSCHRRQPWLGTAEQRDLFLNILEEVRKEHRFVVAGYVVMPEHLHVLMSEPQIGNPSTAMQSVKQRFAQRVIPRSRRSPAPCKNGKERGTPTVSISVWEPRFYDFNVWTERKRIEKLGYMHDNPVKRGLVDKPEDWLWSSYRSYGFGEPGLVKINDCDILRMKVRKLA